MKKILLGTTLLFGLAGQAFATGVNTIAIDDGVGSVGSLAITQDDTAVGNTVSSNGSTGSAAAGNALAINGPWSSIAITQTGAGNTLKGTSIISSGSSTAGVVTANYTTANISGGTNIHKLGIGHDTAPLDPSVTVNVSNTGGAQPNTITDNLDATALTYNLAISGYGNTLTNKIRATGAVTLNQGGSSSANITGNSNTIDNEVGANAAVTSFEQTLLISGNSNQITNTVDSDGEKTVDQSVRGSSNVIATTVSGGGAQTANLILTGSNVDYGITSAANGSYANVSLTDSGASSNAPDVVRVEQTNLASGATAILTVAGGVFTMGNLSSVTGTYSTDARLAGVSIYQNSSGAYLNASVTGAANGYTAVFKQ